MGRDRLERVYGARQVHPHPTGQSLPEGGARHRVLLATRQKDTYFSARYRRLKALITIEYSMLAAIWHVLQNGITYSDPGADYSTRRDRNRAKKRALDQLRDLGYTVTLKPKSEDA